VEAQIKEDTTSSKGHGVMTINYLTISSVVALIAVAAFSYTLGSRAIASTMEDNLAGYVGNKINISIVKAVLFFFIAFLALVLSIRLSVAEFVSGDLFVKTCHDPNPERHAACIGFIAGVTDSYLRSGQFCLPPNIQEKEVSQFVVEYSAKTLSIRNQPASGIVLLALKARFPCISSGPRIVFQFRGF
jgi:hypothetical protein